MIRILSTAAAATLALGLTAVAGEKNTFDIDRDSDGKASFESFNASFDQTGRYDSWDTDGDGNLTREEFNQGVYRTYDLNEDEYLDDDEISTMGNDRMFYEEGKDQAQDEAQTNN